MLEQELNLVAEEVAEEVSNENLDVADENVLVVCDLPTQEEVVVEEVAPALSVELASAVLPIDEEEVVVEEVAPALSVELVENAETQEDVSTSDNTTQDGDTEEETDTHDDDHNVLNTDLLGCLASTNLNTVVEAE